MCKINVAGRILAAAIACVGWWALSAQSIQTIQEAIADGGTLADGIWQIIAYFTMLTNAITAMTMTMIAFERWPQQTLNIGPVLAGVVLYILAVALVYNLALRPRLPLHGWPRAIDDGLHITIPILTAFFWLVFAPKADLQYRHAFAWLIYPLLYVGCTLLHGAYSGWYPYPFIDIQKFGVWHVLLNAFALVAAFLLSGFLLIAATRGARRYPYWDLAKTLSLHI